MTRYLSVLLGVVGGLSLVSTVTLHAQDGCPGRVFLDTPETIAIWEFNDALVDIDELEIIPDGTIFEDLSGNGLDATVEGNDSGDFVVGLGSEEFDEGIDDPTRGSARRSPAGVHIDAARVQSRAMEPEEVEENWVLISDGEPVGEGGEECGSPGTTFRRGDADNSGAANISDAVNILNFLFTAGGGPTCAEAADVNDDGTINITDPVGLLNFLFGGGSGPADPGTETCGPDPADSPGDLGCEVYTTC